MSATVEAQARLDIPTGPKPLYPDVPWWSVLVTAMVFSVVSVIATALVMKASPSGLPGVPGIPAVSTGGLALDTVMYLPHILLLFGVLADMFTYDGVWSIPSLIGVLSIFINYLFQYFWGGLDELWNTTSAVVQGKNTGSTSQGTGSTTSTSGTGNPFTGGGKGDFGKEYDGCTVQGFGSLATEYAPQSLVVTATVLSYYCFDLVANRGWINSAAAVTFFILAYISQMGALAYLPCEPNFKVLPQGVRALVEGLFVGGSSYGIVQTYYPSRLPSSTVSPFPRKTASDLTPGPDGTLRDSDGFPYVVLPNGQAVPDLSNPQSRQAFGRLAAENLGTGTPATSCSVNASSSADQRLSQIAALAYGS